MSRDTRTGGIFEAMIIHPLEKGGYQIETQVLVGKRPNGRKHNVDVTALRDGKHFLVSLKWQQTSGTAEQKVPFEVMCLTDIIKNQDNPYKHAYLVLGGDGWTLREFYISEAFKKYLNLDNVRVLTLESFVGLANRGLL
jgi:hypothetical protein